MSARLQAGPWAQIWHEFAQPPPESDWYTDVSFVRGTDVDRITPPVGRAVLVLTIIAIYIAIGAPSWIWPIFLLPLTQCTSEILLESQMRDGRPRDGATTFEKAAFGFWHRQKEIIRVNVTGLLGAAACPALVLATAFAQSPGQPGPARVATFALAILYLNSGMLGPLMDEAIFSTNGRRSRVMLLLNPWWWAIITAGLLLVVAIASAGESWPPGAVGYAYLSCGLAFYIGLRQRQYERALRSSELVHLSRNHEHARALNQRLHDICQPVKGLIDSDRPGHESGDSQLRAFLDSIELTLRMSRSSAPGHVRIPTPTEVISDRIGATGLPISFETDTHHDQLDHDDRLLCDGLVTTLCYNALQAYEKFPVETRGWIKVESHLNGDIFQLEVSDGLPLIPLSSWTGSPTLAHCRDDVSNRGGTMTQQELSTGKIIKITWPRARARKVERHTSQ